MRKLRLNRNKAEASSKELDECYGSWARRWSSSISSGKLDGCSVSAHQLNQLKGLAHSDGDS
ncbi:hypothetical protein F2Q70_00038534 [Brassica cretica]|uniref:Uncharacterized protein n=1 Tax=Brassica cretica TaxID=69181 RepID=A0A8S9MN42_BRACR|nr:hypothetical protein F2Q70_00038534 [Brassica cretica]KAF2618739.1 hypothetical protein F2Q68_00039172 [Brassica cretica]